MMRREVYYRMRREGGGEGERGVYHMKRRRCIG